MTTSDQGNSETNQSQEDNNQDQREQPDYMSGLYYDLKAKTTTEQEIELTDSSPSKTTPELNITSTPLEETNASRQNTTTVNQTDIPETNAVNEQAPPSPQEKISSIVTSPVTQKTPSHNGSPEATTVVPPPEEKTPIIPNCPSSPSNTRVTPKDTPRKMENNGPEIEEHLKTPLPDHNGDDLDDETSEPEGTSQDTPGTPPITHTKAENKQVNINDLLMNSASKQQRKSNRKKFGTVPQNSQQKSTSSNIFGYKP